jgi:hypothetical protein
MRLTISTRVFVFFLRIRVSAEMVLKLQVATAYFSWQPSRFKLIKIKPFCCKGHEVVSKLSNSSLTLKIKIP